MSRQGNPFVRPCPRDVSCRFRRIPAFRLRAFAAFPPRHGPRRTWPGAPPGRRAQVPLADNNARKLAHACGTSARKPATGLPERPWRWWQDAKRLVTNADQKVIRSALDSVIRVSSQRWKQAVSCGLGRFAGSAPVARDGCVSGCPAGVRPLRAAVGWVATRASEVASHLPALPPRAPPDWSAVSGAMTPKLQTNPGCRLAAGPRANRAQLTPVPSASQARALDPPERHETPDSARSNALNVRFHGVRHPSAADAYPQG